MLSLPAQGADPITELPYRIDYDGWITVSAMVNGKGPYDFIVDSGATITAVFANLSDTNAFTLADRPPIRVLGLVTANSLPAVNIGDIAVGNQRLAGHVGVVLPNWKNVERSPSGVIGLDFLTQYKVYIDADKRTIRLYDRQDSAPLLPDGWSKTRMRADDFASDASTLYRITVNMYGRRIPCIIDLGASGTIVNYRALRRLYSGVYTGQSGRKGFSTGSRLSDIFENVEISRPVRIPIIKIANAQWRQHIVHAFDAPIFEELGVHRKPFCLVGTDLMAEHSFIFDFTHETLYMGPKARRNAAGTG